MGYETESWDIRVEDICRLETIKMRMLRMNCKGTLMDKIRNECIREITGIESISTTEVV